MLPDRSPQLREAGPCWSDAQRFPNSPNQQRPQPRRASAASRAAARGGGAPRALIKGDGSVMKKLIWMVLCVALTTSASLAAQVQSGTIAGVVKDEQGG